jgi:hypothetical protein
VLADLAWRHFGEHEAPPPAPVSAPDAAPAEPKAQAPNENLPAASIVTNPEGAAPAANSQPPRAVPSAATDD